tara:strand:- start:553 stop:1035 length:483 start_codon:yes stop_codon:yes gene_type:complete
MAARLDVDAMAADIYGELGAGYSERVYHNAAEVYLRDEGLRYETERHINVPYREHVVGDLRADIIVEREMILEFKTVKKLGPKEELQARNYLNLTGLKLAKLVNFPPESGRTPEVTTIDLISEKEELSRAFDKIHGHHQTVIVDLQPLLPDTLVPERDEN